jgi:outer membrane lipoprotein SlyB
MEYLLFLFGKQFWDKGERNAAMKIRLICGCAGLVLGLSIAIAAAQQMIIYPGKGQSQSQLAKDKFECADWAKKETGSDPMIVTSTTSAPPAQPSSKASVGRGALGGAAVGAAIGSLSGNMGKGAAIGGVTGGVVGGMRRSSINKQQQQAQQQASQQAGASYDEQMSIYNRARAACLESRGYTVK